MNRARLLRILDEAFRVLADKLSSIPKESFPLNEETTLESLGIDASNVQLLMRLLEIRLGIQINFRFMLTSNNAAKAATKSENRYSTVGHMLTHIESSIRHHIKNPTVIFIDPDSANTEGFENALQDRFRVRIYTDPLEACHLILKDPDIVLAIVRETMPVLSGEILRQAVHRHKPFMKFILIEDGHRKRRAPLHLYDREKFYAILPGPINWTVNGEEIFQLLNNALTLEYP